MAQGPCLNPNCKSEGASHPNCHCYDVMADGGEVTEYCAKGLPHKPDCAYFVDGGEVSYSDIPEGFQSPTPPTEQQPTASEQFSDMPEGFQSEQPHQQSAAPSTEQYSDIPGGFESEENKYTTPQQKVLAGIEGSARGATFNLSDLAVKAASPLRDLATSLGIDPDVIAPSMEDVIARKKYNPEIAQASNAVTQIASMVTGRGAPAAIGNLAKRLTPEGVTAMSKVGAAALRGFITNAALEGGDEISNHLLTGEGDPAPSVSSSLVHMGAAGLLGAGVGVGGSALLQGAAKAKLAARARSFLAGVGGSTPEVESVMGGKWWNKLGGSLGKEHSNFEKSAFDLGVKFREEQMLKLGENTASAIGKDLGAAAGVAIGTKVGNVPGGVYGSVKGAALGDKYITPYLEKLIGKPLNWVGNKGGTAAALKTLAAGDSSGLWDVLNNTANMSKGATRITRGVDALFKIGGKETLNAILPNDRDRERLKKYVEDGEQNDQLQSISQPAFADGGVVTEVNDNPIATQYPDYSMMLNTAKGRINNYLNANRPLPKSQLPFDSQIKDTAKEREYDKLLDIANQPLGILKHVSNGSLDATQVKHFVSMYPEVHSELSKKMSQRIARHLVEKDVSKPPYKVIQAMSLFMGSPLDSSMTPSSIQAAQNTFAPKQPPTPGAHQPKGGGSKKSSNSLSKLPTEFKTPGQAAASRQQDRK